MATNKDYCDYATQVALKELGYNYPLELITDYFGVLDVPFHDKKIHLYDAQKWLREEKQMVLHPAYLEGANVWICEICYKRERLGFGGYNQSYEEALLEGIKEAVKILKED